MYRIDFRKDMEVVKGQDKSEGIKLNELLAFILSKTQDTKNPIKLWHWSKELSASGVIELDKADLDLLKSVITNDPNLFVSGKGQLLELVDSAKEISSKKES